MERNFLASQGYKLESQIREAYGRVTYTQTCHDKIVKRLNKKNENIKVCQIVLSAMTTGSFIATILGDGKISAVVGTLLSLILLILNAYVKNFNLVEKAEKHKRACDLLWKIREEYVSLLTDFDALGMDLIMVRRDELQNRTAEVYSNFPRTDTKSYLEAQKALKTEEEQTFSEHEIDVMLPNAIRRCNRNFNKINSK